MDWYLIFLFVMLAPLYYYQDKNQQRQEKIERMIDIQSNLISLFFEPVSNLEAIADISPLQSINYVPDLHQKEWSRFYYRQAVMQYVENNGDINAIHPKNGKSILHFAALSGDEKLFKSLVSKIHLTKELNLSLGGFTALGGNVKIMELLIENGLDINYNESNILYTSIWLWDEEMINFLISQGVNLNAKDANGLTPLRLASKNKQITSLLKQNGAR